LRNVPANRNRIWTKAVKRRAEAKQAVGALLAFDPDSSLRKFKLNFEGKYARSADFEDWIAGLRRAGLPD